EVSVGVGILAADVLGVVLAAEAGGLELLHHAQVARAIVEQAAGRGDGVEDQALARGEALVGPLARGRESRRGGGEELLAAPVILVGDRRRLGHECPGSGVGPGTPASTGTGSTRMRRMRVGSAWVTIRRWPSTWTTSPWLASRPRRSRTRPPAVSASVSG